jgi:FtsH-binding integral membrane protein
MKLAFPHLRFPALISSALVLPLVILELVNRRDYHEGFPVPLFGILWLLPMAFVLVLMPIVRKVQAGARTTPDTIGILLGGVLLILIASAWAGILLDQMPCFLGVPFCD